MTLTALGWWADLTDRQHHSDAAGLHTTTRSPLLKCCQTRNHDIMCGCASLPADVRPHLQRELRNDMMRC